MAEVVTASTDPFASLRSRRYVALLLFAAVLGVVVAGAAYWFLRLITVIQKGVYSDLPHWLGFHGEPTWWPILPLVLAGLVVGLTIRYLPGRGGESPADGFKAGGVAKPAELTGIAVAALASIGLGVVIGPEAPLIALGGGLAFLAVVRDADHRRDDRHGFGIGVVLAAAQSEPPAVQVSRRIGVSHGAGRLALTIAITAGTHDKRPLATISDTPA